MFRWMGVLAGCLLLSSCGNSNPVAPVEKVNRQYSNTRSQLFGGWYEPKIMKYLSINGTFTGRVVSMRSSNNMWWSTACTNINSGGYILGSVATSEVSRYSTQHVYGDPTIYKRSSTRLQIWFNPITESDSVIVFIDTRRIGAYSSNALLNKISPGLCFYYYGESCEFEICPINKIAIREPSYP